MKRGVGALLWSGVLSVLLGSFALAGSATLVISEVQTRTVTSASEEFIELYNTSIDPVDVTHWCLQYRTPTSSSGIACIEPTRLGSDDRVFVQATSAIFFASKTYQTIHALAGLDAVFSIGLSEANNRAVVILDSEGAVIDAVEWSGSSGGLIATLGEGGLSAPTPTTTQLLGRRSIQLEDQSEAAVVLQDTDNNAADFELRPAKETYSYGALYEAIDICQNIDGFQAFIPEGYMIEGDLCIAPPVDVCSNIEGLQESVPENYGLVGGDCLADVCLNLEGVQMVVPEGYRLESDTCLRDLPVIELSELLPNPSGVDDGHEFVELYNPGDTSILLDDYVLVLSGSSIKTYPLRGMSALGPHEFRSLYDVEIGFSLTNTALSVAIWSSDGQVIDEGTSYEDAKDDMAWARFGDVWQYTAQPTPGSANEIGVTTTAKVVTASTSPTLKPCAANQYRNPETNRCKLVASVTTALTPCAPGQYRNPETNRCKKLETVAASLVPCDSGYERNPETNRCRKVASGIIPAADYALVPIETTQKVGVDSYVLVGVIVLTIGYAAWEWREEITKLYQTIVKRLHP